MNHDLELLIFGLVVQNALEFPSSTNIFNCSQISCPIDRQTVPHVAKINFDEFLRASSCLGSLKNKYLNKIPSNKIGSRAEYCKFELPILKIDQN